MASSHQNKPENSWEIPYFYHFGLDEDLEQIYKEARIHAKPCQSPHPTKGGDVILYNNMDRGKCLWFSCNYSEQPEITLYPVVEKKDTGKVFFDEEEEEAAIDKEEEEEKKEVKSVSFAIPPSNVLRSLGGEPIFVYKLSESVQYEKLSEQEIKVVNYCIVVDTRASDPKRKGFQEFLDELNKGAMKKLNLKQGVSDEFYGDEYFRLIRPVTTNYSVDESGSVSESWKFRAVPFLHSGTLINFCIVPSQSAEFIKIGLFNRSMQKEIKRVSVETYEERVKRKEEKAERDRLRKEKKKIREAMADGSNITLTKEEEEKRDQMMRKAYGYKKRLVKSEETGFKID